MKYLIKHIVLLGVALYMLGIQVSCVAPNQIEILGERQWTVYGLIGPDRAPIIFVYKFTEDAAFSYHTDAHISLRHEATGLTTPLVAVIAGEELDYSYNEFPFNDDWSGHRVYYSTPNGLPLPGGDYHIDLDLGKEQGSANVVLPAPVRFSKVEIQSMANNNGNLVDRLIMSIDDVDGIDYYKWEISINQTIDVQIPIEFDPSSGEPLVFEQTPILFSQTIIPNNFITERKIEQTQNEFTYNLSANFPDFAYTSESYLLNVRLRHYSEDLVEFFESIDAQESGAIFDPFIEPVFIRSNIVGLPGVIGTYAYSEDYLLEYQP